MVGLPTARRPWRERSVGAALPTEHSCQLPCGKPGFHQEIPQRVAGTGGTLQGFHSGLGQSGSGGCVDIDSVSRTPTVSWHTGRPIASKLAPKFSGLGQD